MSPPPLPGTSCYKNCNCDTTYTTGDREMDAYMTQFYLPSLSIITPFKHFYKILALHHSRISPNFRPVIIEMTLRFILHPKSMSLVFVQSRILLSDPLHTLTAHLALLYCKCKMQCCAAKIN